MQWIKASERLPNPHEPKHLIVQGSVGTGEWNSYKQMFIGPGGWIEVPLSEIFWLDESLPASAEDEAARLYPYDYENYDEEDHERVKAIRDAMRLAHITCAGMYTDTIDKLRNALQDLVEAVPKQQVNVDWWDDSMSAAMKQAQELLK